MPRWLPLLAGVALLVLLPGIAAGSPADELRRADEFRRDLSASAAMRRQRVNWEKGIALYSAIARKYPKQAVAPKALYEAANLTAELQRYSGFRSDLIAARDLYRKVAEGYARSPVADDALYRAGLMERKLGNLAEACATLQKVASDYPRGGYADLAKREVREIQANPDWKPARAATPVPPPPQMPQPPPVIASPPPPEPASPWSATPPVVAPSSPGEAAIPGSATPLVVVEGIRFWANPEYTRVVLDLSAPSRPTHFAIAGSEEAKLPPRIVIDIPSSTLKDPQQQPVEVGNGLLRRIRAGRYTADQARVVLDLESVGSYHTFTLPNPDRIVIDVFGAGSGAGESVPVSVAPAPSRTPVETARTEPAAMPGASEPTPTLAQQLGLGVRRVIVDPGHGGKDPGAIGPSGLKEKDVVLDIGLKLREILRERYGLEVIMTRETDVYLELPERTAIANTKEADLFISIHANASRRRAAAGVETYYLNLASSRESAETAARENMTSVAGIGDLNKILAELLVTTKVVESSKFARIIHGSTVNVLRKKYGNVQDLGVKQAPFYVLIGALMPSILSEVSFISNKAEEKKLSSESYRSSLAESLALGIGNYLKAIGKG